MFDFDTAARLVRLQERLRRSTHLLIRQGEVHKSGEAAVTLSFHLPPVVGDDDKPHWSVNVWSYLLCPDGRQATWIAASPLEAIAKAEDAVAQWCMETEMNEFAAAMGETGDTCEGCGKRIAPGEGKHWSDDVVTCADCSPVDAGPFTADTVDPSKVPPVRPGVDGWPPA